MERKCQFLQYVYVGAFSHLKKLYIFRGVRISRFRQMGYLRVDFHVAKKSQKKIHSVDTYTGTLDLT